jgi:hypothetical protein
MIKECLKSSKHIIDFYTDKLLLLNLEPRKLGQEIRKNVLPYIALLTSTIEKAHFIKSIAQKTFIKEEALWEDLKNAAVSVPHPETADKQATLPAKRIEAIERRVFGTVLWQKENKNRDPDVNIEEIEERVIRILGDRHKELETKYQPEKDLILFEIESYYSGGTNLKRDINNLLFGLEEEYLKQRFTIAMANLQKAEQIKNSADILKYLEECQTISQQINTIKNNYEK